MKERPILFQGAMVRAILNGSKTQTRRLVKPQPIYDHMFVEDGMVITTKKCTTSIHSPLVSMLCPHGERGDQLWVRETFGYVSPDETRRPHSECNIEYRADLPLGCTDRPGQWPADECVGDPERPRWRPSIHMPRAASRIQLEIVSVRVERLNSCSEADAIAEGVPGDLGMRGHDDLMVHVVMERLNVSAPVARYVLLWDSINSERPNNWNCNPYVWVVEFKRIKP